MQWEQWRNNSDALVAGPIPAGEYTTLPVALQPSDVALQGSFTIYLGARLLRTYLLIWDTTAGYCSSMHPSTTAAHCTSNRPDHKLELFNGMPLGISGTFIVVGVLRGGPSVEVMHVMHERNAHNFPLDLA